MRTCGLMSSFIPLGWSAVFKCQFLGVELLQRCRNKKIRKVVTNFKSGNLLQNHVYLVTLSEKYQSCSQNSW